MLGKNPLKLKSATRRVSRQRLVGRPAQGQASELGRAGRPPSRRRLSCISQICCIWEFLICCFIKIGPQSAQKVKQKNIQIYPRYIQDIQGKYKIPSGRLVFFIYLGYLGYILDIFGYLFVICLFRRTGVQLI